MPWCVCCVATSCVYLCLLMLPCVVCCCVAVCCAGRCAVSRCFVLCCVVLCCVVLCCVVLCCVVLCCVVTCCVVLCCAVLCCAVLCCAVLCCVVFCAPTAAQGRVTSPWCGGETREGSPGLTRNLWMNYCVNGGLGRWTRLWLHKQRQQKIVVVQARSHHWLSQQLHRSGTTSMTRIDAA